MMDESTRKAVALKRFSLIAPVINKQVKNNMAYYIEVTKEPIDMPFYGTKKYAPKTLESWYCDYIREGSIDALMPSTRGDKGCFRKLSEDFKQKIIELRKEYPKAPATIIYEMLDKSETVSPSTVFRFLKSISKELNMFAEDKEREIKMYSHEFPNEVWQSDIMFGPYIKKGKERAQVYLLAYIDDATRLITHGEFYHLQNFDVLRCSFREAVLKRGIPRILYTDNGKIFRSQQFEWMCADIGTSLIHSKPYVPRGRGKIERFFKTVRKRFLSRIDVDKIRDIDELNELFQKWLNEDYQKKVHSSLEEISPLDMFMLNISKVNIPENTSVLTQKFYLRAVRKVNHAGTFSLKNFIYETSSKFTNTKINVRYEPQWLGSYENPLLIFNEDNHQVGEARLIDYFENSNMKRKSLLKNSKSLKEETLSEVKTKCVEQTISFKNMD